MFNKIKIQLYRLLRRSEKWTKTDMVYLARNMSWLTLAKLANIAAGLGLAMIYARFLSKTDYAAYKYVLSVASLLAISALPGMNTSLIRSVTLGYEGSLKEVVFTKLKWSFAGMLAGLSIAGYYFYNNNLALGIAFTIAALVLPIINSLIWGPYLQGKKKFKAIAKFNLITQLISIGVIAPIVWFWPRFLPLILVYYGTSLISHLGYFYWTIKKYPPSGPSDPHAIPFGKHLSLMGVLGALSQQADKILLWHLLGARELAIYSFAVLPVEQISSFLKSFSTIAFPKIAASDINLTKKTLPKKVLKFMGTLLVPVFAYILAAPYLYKIFFPQYLEAVKYSQIFAFTLLFSPQRIFSHILIAEKNTKSLYLLKIINPLLKIISYSIFIYLFNIYGAIIGSLVGLIIGGLLLYYFSIVKKYGTKKQQNTK